ncbi:MAG: hypothetical protein AAF648_06050 [Pseudomonadota bacterium]
MQAIRIAVYSFFFVLLAAVAGCGGGSNDSSSAAFSGGQDPDPVVVDFPIAYVKRVLQVDDDGELLATDVRRPLAFLPGAELLIRQRASATAAEVSLTADVFPPDEDGNPALYDVKDLSTSADGLRLVFALRAPEDPDLDDDEQPTWNIWFYDRETDELRRVIVSDLVAEDGDDIAPRFLPDGRILFSSTRQRISKAVLLDEGKPQFSALDEDRDEPALALHVMNDDGTEIRQITFNQSSDLDPMVLRSGRVAFARWDNVPGRDRISLYSANPDGTEFGVLYGIHSHDTGPNGQEIEFVEPKELPDGRLLVLLRPAGEQSTLGTVPVAIDVDNYSDHDRPIPDSMGLLSDAQEVLFPGDLTLEEDRPPLQGRYASVFPLFDGTNRLLVAWSQCRLRDTTADPAEEIIRPCIEPFLSDENYVEADPFYGIWMHDLAEQTQQPILQPESGEVFSEVIVLEDRTSPPVILDKTAGIELDADLVSESVGVLHVRNVYELDGVSTVDIATLADPALVSAAERPIRYLRVVKPVSIPDEDLVDLPGTAFGRSQVNLMREVLGYAPVEPDGSVKVKIPANVAFSIELLDANGRRVFPRHLNWLQLRPGEELECRGCHTAESEVAHGRPDAQLPSSNAGALVDGSPFPNTEPALFANAGETMAEVYARINGTPDLSVDLRYTDVWTDPNVRAKDPDDLRLYSDLSTPAPVDSGCVTNWSALCRTVIHYETHIHPLWAVDRQQFDADGLLIGDNTCIACHAPVDAMNMAMVPAAQLDLSDGPSPDEADHFNSYRELLFNDNEIELIDGALLDRLVQALDGDGNPLFETDPEGELILDAEGNPIPILVTVGVQPSLNVGGANNSPRFFSLFEPGGSHFGYLNAAELKLVSEWLDLGGQYYNDPFVVPQ